MDHVSNSILMNVGAFLFTVFLKSILVKFVQENIKSISEAIRNSFYQSSALFGGLAVILPAKFISPTMLYWCL